MDYVIFSAFCNCPVLALINRTRRSLTLASEARGVLFSRAIRSEPSHHYIKPPIMQSLVSNWGARRNLYSRVLGDGGLLG
jgi:hypothetical protein